MVGYSFNKSDKITTCVKNKTALIAPKNSGIKNLKCGIPRAVFHLRDKTALNQTQLKDLSALTKLRYIPKTIAIVPPEIPGIKSEVPMANPLRNVLPR